MSRAPAVLLAGLLTLVGTRAARADPYASLTVGLPEVAHGELGVTVGRLALAARAGFTLFNTLAGVSATWHLTGEPGPSGLPRGGWLVGVHAMKNLYTSAWTGHGETIAAYVSPRIGYGLAYDGGFLMRFELGAAASYQADHWEAGPTFELTLGYWF